VLEKTGYKREGFFVEFGATDGVVLSNTLLLEKQFGWNGICAEPNPKFFKELSKNRRCIVSNACIGSLSGEKIEFIFADAYGGMKKHADSDMHQAKREAYYAQGETALLTTISLHDFLTQYKAPKLIDYMSAAVPGQNCATH
jgi:hypothetical protein